MTLYELARDVVATYDVRLLDEKRMIAFSRAVEKLRSALKMPDVPVFTALAPCADPEAMPLELQAMKHISTVLGALPPAARVRALMVVALALAPDAFSQGQYGELLKRAKGA